ncbi:hypothetical protein [Mucilaginibacter sp. UYCu711]|uniref:hypothetical protein n=1 Tax=Mucilaginibacter sp. UYCu711 TaxID=3156339 RepID=UPI003D21E94E
MKNFVYRLSMLCVGIVSLASCNNKQGNPEPGLTNCKDCQFLFSESADIAIPGYNLISGSYRLFWSETKKSVVTQKMFIKAPMQGNSFTLTKADIIAGKVVVLDICPSCDLIGVKPVDGFVKGENTTPTSRGDKSRWLIEAKIIREPVGVANIKYRDTIYIKQYFEPNFMLN